MRRDASGVGPQGDKNRLTAESKCGEVGNRASKVFGTQGTQKRARTETCLGLAKLSLRGICPLGCVMGIAPNPEKKWIDLQKENCLSWKGNLCSTTCTACALRKFFPFAERKRI